jgi:hypothetical protein
MIPFDSDFVDFKILEPTVQLAIMIDEILLSGKLDSIWKLGL